MKILAATTAAVVATSLMATAMIDDAQAGHTKIEEFKCEEGIGSFFPPTASGTRVHTSSYTKCNNLGSSTSASVLDVAGTVEVDGVLCVTLRSPDGLPGFALSEKGFITSTADLVQCFFNADGGSVEADGISGFCDVGDDQVHTSTLTGTITITGGIVDKHRVVGGAADVASDNFHCAGFSAPYGNFGTTTELVGEIETEEDEIADDDLFHEIFNQ